MLAQARPVTESGNQPVTIEQLLAAARAGLRRLDPAQAAQAARAGARLVDIRPESHRRADGEIPGYRDVSYDGSVDSIDVASLDVDGNPIQDQLSSANRVQSLP
jgi:hypothetical protein